MNIEAIAKAAGMETDCMNKGAASCVYTDGCEGVAQEQLEAFAAGVRAEERARLRVAGGLLANVAFNLAQKPGHALTSDDVAMLDKLRREWDAALKA
jgi:hypothetical protein